MLLDAVVTGAVVTAALAYLAWRFLPRKRAAPVSCAACAGENRK